MATGHFDSNATDDILFRGQNGDLAYWTLDANANPVGGLFIPRPGDYWDYAGTRDFNGDGQYDLLWKGQSGEIFEWTMFNNQIVGGNLIANPGNFWTVIG